MATAICERGFCVCGEAESMNKKNINFQIVRLLSDSEIGFHR
jgi:hypothetical protein